MSPRPVSLVVWRDARTDPRVFGDATREVFVRRRGLPNPEVDVHTTIWLAKDVAHDRGNVVLLWAEVPVVSDLTDDDVRDAAQQVEHAALGVRNNVAARSRAALAIRLRAALGGEKEET